MRISSYKIAQSTCNKSLGAVAEPSKYFEKYNKKC
jgi:hypothetical protein